MIEDLGIWLFSGPGVVRRLLVGVIIAIAIGVAIAPAIAAARWAARGRTRLVRPSCRHCRALLGEVADGAIAERCPECGRSTSARGAVRWTTRGSRVFSLTVTLPTMLLAACGIGFLVHLTLRTGIDLWRQSLDGALREATRQASRDAVLARLEAIERGERSDLDGMLAFHLNQVEGTSHRDRLSCLPRVPSSRKRGGASTGCSVTPKGSFRAACRRVPDGRGSVRTFWRRLHSWSMTRSMRDCSVRFGSGRAPK
jgi:hypothetical protein